MARKNQISKQKLIYLIIIIFLPIFSAMFVQFLPQARYEKVSSLYAENNPQACQQDNSLVWKEISPRCYTEGRVNYQGWPIAVANDPSSQNYSPSYWVTLALLINTFAIIGATYALVFVSVWIRHEVFHTAADGTPLKEK